MVLFLISIFNFIMLTTDNIFSCGGINSINFVLKCLLFTLSYILYYAIKLTKKFIFSHLFSIFYLQNKKILLK